VERRHQLADLVLDLGRRGEHRRQLAAAASAGASSPTWWSTSAAAASTGASSPTSAATASAGAEGRQLADLVVDLGCRGYHRVPARRPRPL
jgi:hypothetical protein